MTTPQLYGISHMTKPGVLCVQADTYTSITDYLILIGLKDVVVWSWELHPDRHGEAAGKGSLNLRDSSSRARLAERLREMFSGLQGFQVTLYVAAEPGLGRRYETLYVNAVDTMAVSEAMRRTACTHYSVQPDNVNFDAPDAVLPAEQVSFALLVQSKLGKLNAEPAVTPASTPHGFRVVVFKHIKHINADVVQAALCLNINTCAAPGMSPREVVQYHMGALSKSNGLFPYSVEALQAPSSLATATLPEGLPTLEAKVREYLNERPEPQIEAVRAVEWQDFKGWFDNHFMPAVKAMPKAEPEPEPPYVVLDGDMETGFKAYGPYNEQQAQDHLLDHGGKLHILPLNPPTK